MAETVQEKTEQPTGRRISKAREKGQVPQSQEFLSFISILVLVTMTAFLAPNMMRWFVSQIRIGMSAKTSVFTNTETFINFANAKIVDSTILMSPILIALCIGAICGSIFIGGGFNIATNALKLDLSLLSPATGLKNLVNVRSGARLLVSIIKLVFVAGIVCVYLRSKLDDFAPLRWAWSFQILTVISKMILGLMIRVCVALLVIAIADIFFQKWKYTKDLKMTKQETKEEQKQTEGDPIVKKRIRSAQLAIVLKRIMQEVPKADVVLVNPTHVAVALKYDAKTMEAPTMLAKGADHIAEKIREVARAYGIPIIRRPELARTIYSTVEPGNPIPETLYVAVAEILALIYRLRHKV